MEVDPWPSVKVRRCTSGQNPDPEDRQGEAEGSTKERRDVRTPVISKIWRRSTNTIVPTVKIMGEMWAYRRNVFQSRVTYNQLSLILLSHSLNLKRGRLSGSRSAPSKVLDMGLTLSFLTSTSFFSPIPKDLVVRHTIQVCYDCKKIFWG